MPDNQPAIEFEVPLTRLQTLIERGQARQFEAYAQAHGVQLEKTDDYTCEDQAGAEPGYVIYRLCFPPGSRRLDALTLLNTTPFKIICPDGQVIAGHEYGRGQAIFQIPDEPHRPEGKTP